MINKQLTSTLLTLAFLLAACTSSPPPTAAPTMVVTTAVDLPASLTEPAATQAPVAAEDTPAPAADTPIAVEASATPEPAPSDTPPPTVTQAATPTSEDLPSPTPVPTIGAGSVLIASQDLRPMVFVPAGSFLMGAGEADANADLDEKPLHEVQLDAYWVDQYEVTHDAYAVCVGAGACNPPAEVDTNGFPYAFASAIQDAPVVNVTWYDARDYCIWAGKRLPTEAEWERAARGEDARIYPWGDDADVFNKTWYCENCIYDETDPGVRDDFSRPATVGSFPEGISPYGAYDMAGNVLEWVFDWYASDTYGQPDRVNPTGPEDGGYRIVRGGSWTSPSTYLRSTYRQARGPLTVWIDVGFRCVMEDDRTKLLYEGQPTVTPTPTLTATPTPTVPTPTPGPTATPTLTAPPPTALPETLPLYQLVYAGSDGRIYVVNSDGSGATAITEEGHTYSSPAWCPTRNVIAIVGPGEYAPAIYTISPDGGDLRKIFEPQTGEIDYWNGTLNLSYQHIDGLRWSPDGSRILFQIIAEHAERELIFGLGIVGAYGDGFVVRPWAYDASWSPTNNQVVFAVGSADMLKSSIRKSNVSLADEGIVLSKRFDNSIRGQPNWSPDGWKIVYYAELDMGIDLMIVNGDGSDRHLLYAGPSFDGASAWSPKGDEIAFVSGSDIYAIRPDGTGLRLINDELTGTVSELEWSPDGTRLAVVVSAEGAYHLYVMRADGTGLVEAAANLSEPYTLDFLSDLSAPPQWSPWPAP